MAVYLIATFDTKGREAAFLRDRLKELGVDVRTVDAGCLNEPACEADVPRRELFDAAGIDDRKLLERRDRGDAVKAAAAGAAAFIERLHGEGAVQGVIGIGGSAGTTIATAAMRQLPLGVPKLMVSTLASGMVRPWVKDKDILMLNPVADITGLNRITRSILDQAARAMAGLVTLPVAGNADAGTSRPVVAATMFGVTTPCVEQARAVLEEAGCEVLVFHATGSGGQAMESLIDEGLIDGVLDLTTTELADELVGGVLSAGPQRLTAAGQRGIPQVISVGATDMVNFGPIDSVPERFAGRRFYEHNPTVTLMRTTKDENRRLGAAIGRKAAAATGPVRILLPLHGVSAIDAAGQPFDDPDARMTLFDAIADHAGSLPIDRRDEHINDASFAQAAAAALLDMLPAVRARQD
ncbi:MAG: Tm-1-like ATP-binding domain-containing protein [Maioricimonas sp. JB049]